MKRTLVALLLASACTPKPSEHTVAPQGDAAALQVIAVFGQPRPRAPVDSTSMPRGTVKSFTLEQGFGTLVLDTGEELPFDVSASNVREPKIGAVAEVTVGIGYKGQPKAKLVLFELEEDRAPSFSVGFKQLQKLGFFAQWDAKQARAAAKEVLDEVPSKLLRAELGGLLQHYYEEGPSARGRAEGVLTLDWRFGQVTQTPAEDVLALCPVPTDVEARTDGDRAWVAGEAVDLAQGLEPLLAALNIALATRAVDARFFTLDVESDFYVIVCRSPGFEQQVAELSFLKLG